MGELTDTLRDFLDGQPRRRPRHGRLRRQSPAVGRLLRPGRRSPADLDRVQAAQGAGRDAHRLGFLCIRGDEQPYPSATFSGPAEILTEEIGASTARIMQRIAGMDEPPEPQTDDALASIDRVILAITVEKVTAVNYIPVETER